MNADINFESLMQQANIIEVLNYNPEKNYLCLLGRIGSNSFILIIKKIFYENYNANTWTSLIKTIKDVKTKHDNDIYKKYISIDTISNEILIDFIYPATEKIIDKYYNKKLVLFNETYETYKLKTLPYIKNIPINDTAWIMKILYKPEETKEKLVYEEEGIFKILQDYKFAGTNTAYGLAIVFDDKIKSLRDINASHLPLLQNIYEKGRIKTGEFFGIDPNNLRAYIHYPPQFFHFHVHIVDVNLELDNSYIINRAIGINSIIQNLKICSDYYQKVDLEFQLQEGGALQKHLVS